MRAGLLGRRGSTPAATVSDHEREPEPDSWPTFGGHDQVLRGESGTGYETAGRLKRTAQLWGQDYGAARTAAEISLGEQAAPNRWLAGAVGVRQHTFTEEHLRRKVAPAKRASGADARKEEARARLRVLEQRLPRIEADLPPAEAKAVAAEEKYRSKHAEYMAMPRMLRGYFERYRVAALVAIAVVVFDCFVLHGILKYSGMDTLTIWGASLTVPLAIAAINHAFGVTAGAIGLRTPARHRMKLAAALFVAGVGAMLGAFVLLTLFREQAAEAQNSAITQIEAGEDTSGLRFFISPIWMGPLQIAGSFGAIALTAFWVMAKQGREFQTLVLTPAREEWHEAEADLAAARRRIESAHEQIEAATLVEHQVESDAQAAQVEVDASDDILKAALAAEDSLREALMGEYEANYTYFDQIGKNGGVWRMALATVFPRIGRPYTPGASDAAADPQLIRQRHAEHRPQPGAETDERWPPAAPSENGHKEGTVPIP